MCQLSAYLVRDKQKELILEDVMRVEVDGKKVLLTTLFQQHEAIDADISVIDVAHNELVLQARDSEERS